MRKSHLAVALICCLVTSAITAQEMSWFDLTNCQICKHMSEQEGLLEHIQWENHVIPDGMLSIAVVPSAYRSKMDAAHEQMHNAGEKMAAGESLKLCGFCESYGALMAEGAKSTELKTVGGDIHMLTSDDPQLVAKIQTHAEKSIDEFKKMMASGEHGHGHDHDHGHSHDHDDDAGHDDDHDHDHQHEGEHKSG